MSKWAEYELDARRAVALATLIESQYRVDPSEIRIDPEYMHRGGGRNLVHVDYIVPNRTLGKSIASEVSLVLRPFTPDDSYSETWVEQEFRWFADIHRERLTVRVYVNCTEEEEDEY